MATCIRIGLKVMLHASIIICAHDPRPNYLDRVLKALRGQVVPYDQWELLLINNASEPALEQRWDISWHPNARHIREDELGLAAARRRAIAEALGALPIFIDDDNVIAQNYISEALRIKQQWPMLGTWGSGKILPEFEEQPADHLKPYLPCLGLRDNKTAYWSNVVLCNDTMPVDAGLCVRASVTTEYSRVSTSGAIRITGRQGKPQAGRRKALVGHEDLELSFAGCDIGLGMGVFPELLITHLIPRERVSDAYMLRLLEGNEISGGLLACKWVGATPPSPFIIKKPTLNCQERRARRGVSSSSASSENAR